MIQSLFFWHGKDIFLSQTSSPAPEHGQHHIHWIPGLEAWSWPLSLRMSGAMCPFPVWLNGTGVSLQLPLSLLKSAVGTLDYVGLNDWIVVNNGLEMVGKEFSWPYLRHHPTIWVGGQRTENSWCWPRVKPDTLECYLEVLPLGALSLMWLACHTVV
jgi:hypothetical protein